MEILNIKILTDRHGADSVFLYTDLPEATFPYKGKQMIEFKCAKGSAFEYCSKYFPNIPATVIRETIDSID